MNLVKWNNFIDKPFSRLINDFFNKDISLNDTWDNNSIPAVNVFETKDDYRVEASVPGLAKEDFDVKLENNLLVISCKKENSREEKDKNYMRKEFSYSSFQRSFYLPEDKIERDQIEANYKDGILLVTVPKKEEAKNEHNVKQIEIV